MNHAQQNPRFSLRNAAVLFFSFSGIIALALLGQQIVSKHKTLRSAPTDNVQWSLAQAQVELLMFDTALHHAMAGRDAGVDEVRRRFNVFYSRIKTLRTGRVYMMLNADAEIDGLLTDIGTTLDSLVPFIDGPDSELRSGLSRLEDDVHDLIPKVRQLTLDGVAIFAKAADEEREAFSNLLLQTGILALVMIAALVGLLAFLVHQSRKARWQAEEVAVSNQRYASMVNSSLDAIVVSDADGRIVDFNPAAESTFGYSRNAAIGRKMHDVIIPPVHRDAHQAGMKRYLATGVPKVIGAGRVELEAMRSDGSLFPAELSIGTAGGSESLLFIGYIRDISKRVRMDDELKRTRDMALAAAKAKSEFLAVMSHEMRTPLNGVMGILDLLAHTDLSPQQEHYLKTAVNSGEILQGHINDVLDITSIEAGALELHPTHFALAPVLDEVAKINEPAAALRGNRIEVSMTSSISHVSHDRGRLSQVVMNLVSNAVKFTSGGIISIEASVCLEDGVERLEIAVSDNGKGMKPEDCSRIFDDFVMLDPSYQRTSQGTGLGLAISRRIVEAMEGEIAVSSVEGEGSRFWLRIPVHAKGEIAPRPKEQQEQPSAVSAGLRVLLVEDNETNRLVAREMLTRAGCTVVEAHDGVEGVERADAEPFDLILMDISMPRLDGISATRRIREGHGESRDAPIVGLTAHAMVKERKDLFAAGMQDCLVKPLRDLTLRTLLSQFSSNVAEARTATVAGEIARDAVLDPETIDELVDLLPEDVIRKRLEGFLVELNALDATDFDAIGNDAEIAALCHRHAGSAAVFGAAPLRKRLLDMEMAATEGRADDVASLASQLPVDLKATRAAVKELLEALDG